MKAKRKPKTTARLMHKITTLTGYHFGGPVDGWVVLKYRSTDAQRSAGHWLWRLANELDMIQPTIGSTCRISDVLAAEELSFMGGGRSGYDRELFVER